MGSSITLPCAMMYLEYFESNHMRQKCPGIDLLMMSLLSIVVMSRILRNFFDLLNSFDPFIKFTYERSRPELIVAMVVRLQKLFPFWILRSPGILTEHLKLCLISLQSIASLVIVVLIFILYHAKPMSTKRSVIKSLFLRTFRYCDAVYLDKKIEKIYSDFTRLGYPRRFIDKTMISVKKGRGI